MKVGMMAMSSNFFAYTALTKPASEKITAPSSTVLMVTNQSWMRTVVNSIATTKTMTPTMMPRSTAPLT